MNDETPHLSPIETLKAQSHGLRGHIAAELGLPDVQFTKDTANLLKHHGMYQQHDRDLRKSADGATPTATLVVRTKIPGGQLTSQQLLAELDLCDELGNGTLRITTRQGLQLHGVRKTHVAAVVRRINTAGLTTFGACGDVSRNVMCCPAPHRQDPVHQQMQEMAERLSAYFLPHTRAYQEMWLDGAATNAADEEPLYGASYLPRKFKMAIGLPGDNCVDIHAHDLGLLAICEDFNVVGYNVLVGGGQSMTPSNAKTFAALAQPMAFVAPDQITAVAASIVGVFRDFGNRGDRKLARLKHLLADWGLEPFRRRVEEYYGSPLAPPRAEQVWQVDNHLGWHDQGDDRWFYGLNVENGRIRDHDGLRLKSALREICKTIQPGVRLTPQQNVLLTDVTGQQRTAIDEILGRHGVPPHTAVSKVRRSSMACVGLPTCPWALAESERGLPGVIDALEVELERQHLSAEEFSVRMTGCPNGCARPYLADVGLVGRKPGMYAIYLGGRLAGDRLGFFYKDFVPAAEIVPTLAPLLAQFATERQPGESFGDYCWRQR